MLDKIVINQDILEKTIAKFGIDRQFDKTLEELNELREAIFTNDWDDILQEVADVMIMINQLLIIKSIEPCELNRKIAEKQTRTIKRMEEGYYG